MYKNITVLGLLTLISIFVVNATAHEDGDALQVQCYKVTASTKPDVSDGLIAASADPTDWSAAYVRVAKMYNPTTADTTDFTMLFGNDDDTLYIAAVGYLPNAAETNDLIVYFDQDNDGALDGSSASPGEYYVRLRANGSAPADGAWNGSAWQANATTAAGLKGYGVRKGVAGPSRLYNYELQIPLRPSAVSGNGYLNLNAGDETGIFFEISMNDGSTYYWLQTNRDNTDPSSGGWGELQLQDRQVAARDISALYAKTYIPTIDGDITNDPNWKYAFQKTITFTDFNGNKLTNSALYLKESGAGNLYIGVKVATNPTNTSDYIQVYFDQGAAGGSLNYVLNSRDDAARVTGAGTYTDMYFNGTNWVADGTNHGSGDATAVGGTAWEFEISKPLNSGDAQDIQIVSTDNIGLLLRYYDATNSRDYWWSATINEDVIQIDPIDGSYSALGWANLATGGPFVQPLYPEQNDIISGTYPFMIYAEDENGVGGIDSVDYRVTDLNDNVFIDYSSSTRLTKVDNAVSGLWITTFNSNTGSTPDGDYNIVFRVLDDDGIRVTSPVRITIQNTGSVGGPTISNVSLNTGDVVAGVYRLTFEVSPTGGNTLVSDSIMISIDGGSWVKVDSTPAVTGGRGRDSVNTVPLNEGVHTIRLRAKDTGDQAWGYSEVIIFNVDNLGSAPIVTITSPTASTEKSGSLAIGFSVTPHTGRSIDSCQISVDGFNWMRTATNSSHSLNTTGYLDGTHIVQIRAYDNIGRIGYSNAAAFIFKNTPSVAVTAPRADSVVSGTLVVAFTATPVSPATIASTAISVDGAAYRATSTAATDTLNTQALTEGSHIIQVRATDSNGKIGYSQVIKFNVQNLPAVAVTAPRADSVVSGTLVVAFTAAPVSPATISTTEIRVDGGSWRATSTGTTDTLDTEALTEGSHTVQIRATDSNGKSGLSQVLKIAVANAPSVAVTSPAADALLSGTVIIEFTATPVSPATIATTEISVDGSEWRETSTGTADTLDTQPLTDAGHLIEIRITDSNGKMAVSRPVKIEVRNAPTVTIDMSLADTVISGTLVVPFTAEPVDPASISTTEIRIDGGTWRETSTGSADTLDTQLMSEGKHDIQIRAVDSNGKTGTSQVITIEVKNLPTVEVDLSLADTVVSGALVVPFTAAPVDPATISTTEIRIDGGAWRGTSTGSADTLDVQPLTDGKHTIQIRVTDSNKKIGLSQILSFVTDNSAPKISLPRVEYAGVYQTGRAGTNITVSALALDIVAGLDKDSGVVFMSNNLDKELAIAVLNDDGVDGDKIKGDNIFSAIVPINTGNTGSVEFSIRARDAVGNDTTILSNIVLDNSPPEVFYNIEPKPKGADSINGEVYVSRVIMKGRALDIGSGLDVVRVTVRNESGGHVNNSPIEVKPDNGNFSRIIDLIPGKNKITLLAVDKAGNMDSLQGDITYLLPKVSKVVTPAGGTVKSPNRSSVKIPKDALFHAAEVTMRVIDQDEEPKPVNKDIKLLGLPHEFGPDGTVFRKPVSITLAYTELDLDPDQDGEADYKPEDLEIYFWDGTDWLPVGNARVNSANKTVSVEVNHFTMFDIGVNTAEGDGVPGKFAAYWTNNPVKENEGSTFVIDLPTRMMVSLSIYDMGGDLVRTLIPEQAMNAGSYSNTMWRGDNVAGEFAGAGLYIYVLKYGNKIIRKPVGLLKN